MLDKLIKMIKRDPPAYLRSFILMPGVHDIMLPDIDGISLKMVSREVMVSHQGLKYWVAAYTEDVDILNHDMQKILGIRARNDLLNLMFFKKPTQHKGYVVNSEGKIFEGGEELGTISNH